MYIVGNEITITWVIAPTDSPLTAEDYDIRFVPSSLDGTYTDDAILTYVAPSALYAGSFTYLFTPNHVGRYQIYLTTGTAASHQVLNKKDFWVFKDAPSSVPSIVVYGPGSYPGEQPYNSQAIGYDNQFYRIDGVCMDPVLPNTLWFCGEHVSGDTKASIAKIDTLTGTITEYLNLVTFPVGKLPGAIAVNRTGRVILTNRTIEGADYEAYYSDSPYTSWTKCTRSAFSTTAAGAGSVKYDNYLDVFWWLTGTKLGVSIDGITFTEQTFDRYGNDVNEISLSSQETIFRLNDVGANVLYCMTATLGGGGERIMATTIAPPFGSQPRAWQDMDGQEDFFGAGPDAQNICGIAPNLERTSAWAMGVENGYMVEAVGGTGFGGTVTDISGQITGVPTRFFTIHDFRKSFLGCRDGGAWNWYESTDMLIWTPSIDTRITGFNWEARLNTDFTQYAMYANNSGVCFVDEVATNNYQIVAMIK